MQINNQTYAMQSSTNNISSLNLQRKVLADCSVMIGSLHG